MIYPRYAASHPHHAPILRGTEVAPWIFSDGIPFGRLVPEGTGVMPTTDGGERNDWSVMFLPADPASAICCGSRQSPLDSETVAQSIRSDPDLEKTVPSAVRVGGRQALVMDVAIAAGAAAEELDSTARGPVFQGRKVVGVPLATGDRMRLYLVDTPDGSSLRILAIAIVAPESGFETAARAASSPQSSSALPDDDVADPNATSHGRQRVR